MQTSVCPSPDELKAYVRGKLDSQQSDLLSQHMLHCSACEQTIVEIEAEPDTLVELLKCEVAVAAAAGSLPGDQQLQHQAPVPAPRADGLQLPIELGQYELQRRLGTGGMGAVYLARHKSLDKQVAIKLLPALPAQHPGFLARFQREMRAAGKLDHPAIVRTTDAGELQGIHFLVMEAIDGMDLSRVVRVEEKLSLADACEIVRQAAIGLAHAHEKGIVHRDVKPSNLMLDVNGQVRILDFGLAQVGLWDSGSAEITTVGQLMGTLDYMAPEQAERGGAVDYRADLYSLGATLFRLLTGRAPLAAAPNLTPLEKLRLLASHKPPKLRSLRSDVPEVLSQIVDAMLSREPSQRPASATHAAELLEPFGTGANLVGLLARAQAKPQVDEASFSINPLLQRDLAKPSSDRNSIAPTTATDLAVTNAQSSGFGSGRSKSSWITWTALAGSFAMLCAGVFIILETSKGQLVIDSQVDVQVKIVAVDESGKRSDGDDLQISPGSKATRLNSGKYEIVLDSASDSFGVTNGTFTIRNGQTVVATIAPKSNTAESGQAAQANSVSRPANIEDPRLNEVVYDGQTLDTWLRRLKFERNDAEVERTLVALVTLADPSLQDVMLEPLIEFSIRTKRHYDNLSRTLKQLSGPAFPKTAATILAGIKEEEDRQRFLRSITSRFDSKASIGFPELLIECKKLLSGKSPARQYEVATALRRLTGDGDGIPEEVRSQIVQMLVETTTLTDETFWLGFPGVYADAGAAGISKEIIKRAIDKLSDTATSEKLKCQAAIALGALSEQKNRIGGRLELSEQDRERLNRTLSAEITKLIAQPTQVNAEVKLPQQFADFVAAKLTFPNELRSLGNTGRETVASPFVLFMHLIDTFDLRDSLKAELQELNLAMRQLPIGGRNLARQIDSPVLYGWKEQIEEHQYRSLLGAVVYLQSGTLLGIPKQELYARFQEKLPADLARDVDQQLDLLEAGGSFSNIGDEELEKLPFESSTRAGLVIEKAATRQFVQFQNTPTYLRLWMRASGDDFCSSYARVLAKLDHKSWSPLQSDSIGNYAELRCANPDKLKPLLAWCDKLFNGSDKQTAGQIAHMLSSLANSAAPNFSDECRELVVKHLDSYKVLDEANFWFEKTLDENSSQQMRVATIYKAIDRLTRRGLTLGTDPLDVVDCQALIILGQSTSDDWKKIAKLVRERVPGEITGVLRKQLETAVQDRTNSARLIQLPHNFSSHVSPQFPMDVPYIRREKQENVRTNLVILILNFIAKPAIEWQNQARESLLPQVEALHETIAKLNLTDQGPSDGSSSWKSTVDRTSRLNELIWHTWYTQSGVLLGKPYEELNNRPERLAREEFERKRRFVQPGDTLAIYIPSVLPLSGDPPVIQAGKGQPITGFPVPVSKEGTIQLPYIDPLVVKDLELSQVLALIKESYTTKHRVLDDKPGPLGITVQYLLRAGSSLELRNIAGSQAVTVPAK